MVRRRLLRTLCILAGAACARPPSPERQIESGRTLFEQACLECHTTGVGPKLSREVLVAYRSAERLYDYLRFAMPYENPGGLAEREYWDIVAYLSVDRDLRDATVALSPETAEQPFR